MTGTGAENQEERVACLTTLACTDRDIFLLLNFGEGNIGKDWIFFVH